MFVKCTYRGSKFCKDEITPKTSSTKLRHSDRFSISMFGRHGMEHKVDNVHSVRSNQYNPLALQSSLTNKQSIFAE
ncbi:hypothetical protein DPMN_083429 [Dreissena polymorpha]|uniref:Uncharacterized protein n=1 Tax=Dreissena polymorpha TaxID=45954 RepID=A0A9D3YCK4_DREPO|nr:hypothetical protein DPMN_083429 [Dreissena polymorpha]